MQDHINLGKLLELPSSTRDYIKEVTAKFPKTPYHGALAISEYVNKNFSYGATENFSSEQWLRYPDQIKKYCNCGDSGVMTYLFAEAIGLDAVLAEFENFRGLNQTHLETIIRGSKYDYILNYDGGYGGVIPITFENNSFRDIKDSDNVWTFDSMRTLYVPDVVSLINEFKKESILSFIRNGQQFDTHIHRSKSKKLFYSVKKFVSVEDNSLLLKNTFHTPLFYLTGTYKGDLVKAELSHGYDNGNLIDSEELFNIDFSVAPKVNHVKHSKETALHLAKGLYKNITFLYHIRSLDTDFEITIADNKVLKYDKIVDKKKLIRKLFDNNTVHLKEELFEESWNKNKDFYLEVYQNTLFNYYLQMNNFHKTTKKHKQEREILKKINYLVEKEGVRGLGFLNKNNK